MTVSSHALKAQADGIAKTLKAMARGEPVISHDPAGKLAAAQQRDSIKFALMMNDQVVSLTLRWDMIRETSEDGIAEYVLKQMRPAKEGRDS